MKLSDMSLLGLFQLKLFNKQLFKAQLDCVQSDQLVFNSNQLVNSQQTDCYNLESLAIRGPQLNH